MFNHNPVISFMITESVIFTYLFILLAAIRANQIQGRYSELTFPFVVNCCCFWFWWPIEFISHVKAMIKQRKAITIADLWQQPAPANSDAVYLDVNDAQITPLSHKDFCPGDELAAKDAMINTYCCDLNAIEYILTSRGVNALSYEFDTGLPLAVEHLILAYEIELEHKERALTSVCDILQNCDEPHMKAAFVFADQARRSKC